MLTYIRGGVMDGLNTKEKILKAAYHCFSEKGYHATSTKEIAKTAGVSEITLFRHFGTKEDIFREVIRNYSILPELHKIKLESDDLSLYETLNLIVRKFYNTLRNRKKFVKITLCEINKSSDEIVNTYCNFIDELDTIVISIFKSKKDKYPIKELNLNIATRGLMGMVYTFFLTNEIFLNKIPTDDELDEAFKVFLEIYLNGIVEVSDEK